MTGSSLQSLFRLDDQHSVYIAIGFVIDRIHELRMIISVFLYPVDLARIGWSFASRISWFRFISFDWVPAGLCWSWLGLAPLPWFCWGSLDWLSDVRDSFVFFWGFSVVVRFLDRPVTLSFLIGIFLIELFPVWSTFQHCFRILALRFSYGILFWILAGCFVSFIFLDLATLDSFRDASKTITGLEAICRVFLLPTILSGLLWRILSRFFQDSCDISQECIITFIIIIIIMLLLKVSC